MFHQNSKVSLSHIKLIKFRNYNKVAVDVGAGPVVLVGQNGAGKTNFLEALSLLTPGRGLRRSRPLDICQQVTITSQNQDHYGDPSWGVHAHVRFDDVDISIATGYNYSKEKRVSFINGGKLSRQGPLGQYMHTLWVTPLMDRLFADGATGRRRFLDRMIVGYDQAHMGRVVAYERALKQRMELLTTGHPDTIWLQGIERQIATRGVAIAVARIHMCEALNGILEKRTGAFPKAHLEMVGGLETWLAKPLPALEVEARFRDWLCQNRPQDAQKGRARLGGHHSDLNVFFEPGHKPASFCSTGEQKALLLSIVFANAWLCYDRKGLYALLLLDEVAAHLDRARRKALFEEVCALPGQVWMTGTELSIFEGLGTQATRFNVHEAKLTAS